MFFSGLFQRKSDAPVTTPAELADAIGLSYDTYTGKQISSQRAMRLTAVFSCVRVLAESVGMLPCNLYHLNGSLKQRATGERLHKLISTHPNGYMTPQEFWELVVTCLCLRGNFYAYKVKAFGEVAELLPVDPGCVVPLHMVQNTDRATFNNIEELGLGFINYSLVPYLTRIEQRINTGLVRKSKQGVYYAKFNAGALLRGDMKSRFEAYATGINWGIYSPNDCRDLEDMNPRPGGDVYLTPMNMTTKPSDGSKAGKQKDNANADETTS
ncbi:phage portal protein [Escherichia coli]|uniref:phage portal protein n=1 Tax=Escherichia coli TaxID=562 RepID=UPI00244A3FB8|nr:phage portal protein [Escherichia coli]